MSFLNKVVIVTGGSSGIGEATVKAFCDEKAKVVIADISDEGQILSDELNHQGHFTRFFKIDVRYEDENRALVAFAVKEFGGLDIVFANAGVADSAPAHLLTYEHWKRVIDINLNAVFLLDKYAITYWMENKTRGVIVNCGSIHSWVGKKGIAAYAASKGGVKLLTQTLAIDYASEGIRVNAICPAYIDTPLLKHLDDKARTALIQDHPIGRLGKPEEVAGAVLFLAGDKAAFINGTALLIDGGYTAQ